MTTQGLRQTLLQRAQELFALCDYSGKGYAYKEEIGALANELPLSPEQLEDVFDALDADGDGKLTLQEFTDGFGMFLGIDSHPRGVNSAGGGEEDEDEDEILEELLDHLGARNLFTDEDYVKDMWHRVRKDDPVMRSNFENFISKVAYDLKQTVAEKETLENALKSREQENESRVQSLYTEMEEQLQRDKEEALARERRKEQQLRDELETELQIKDQQLHELLQTHAQMENQLKELNSEEAETKYENQKLQKDRDILESRLAASEKMLHDMKNHLGLLRKRSLEEKRKRAQAALKVSENIALERENLVIELQQLKELNKQLLDEKDELVQTAAQLVPARKSMRAPKITQLDLIKEESMENMMPSNAFSETADDIILQEKLLTRDLPLTTAIQSQKCLKYSDFESGQLSEYKEDETKGNIHKSRHLLQNKEGETNDSVCKPEHLPEYEEDETDHNIHKSRHLLQYEEGKAKDSICKPGHLLGYEDKTEDNIHKSRHLLQYEEDEAKDSICKPGHLSGYEKNEAKHSILNLRHPLQYEEDEAEDNILKPGHLSEYEEDETEDNICNNLNIPSTKRRNDKKQKVHRSSVKTNTINEKFTNSEKASIKGTATDEFTAPSRVFKVVFVGDSGVGKTSILQRFCTNDFKSTFNATVGIDFQVKTIVVDGERIALQLWDTAGQERFRSLTQQYFRKADGIIVVYDVTVETTFKNVRNWMYLIQEGVPGTSAILLIGNKIDLCESDDDRVVKPKDGERMADEFGSLFYETSAKTGNSIKEAIDALASVLKAKEDEAMEEILKLEEVMKARRKKRCCR